MRIACSPPLVCCIALAFLALLFVPMLAWAGPVADAESASPMLQANYMYNLVANRARLLQFSLVIVALGCAMMWWYR